MQLVVVDKYLSKLDLANNFANLSLSKVAFTLAFFYVSDRNLYPSPTWLARATLQLGQL